MLLQAKNDGKNSSAQAAIENDPKKLIALTEEIARFLREKTRQSDGQSARSSGASKPCRRISTPNPITQRCELNFKLSGHDVISCAVAHASERFQITRDVLGLVC